MDLQLSTKTQVLAACKPPLSIRPPSAGRPSTSRCRPHRARKDASSERSSSGIPSLASRIDCLEVCARLDTEIPEQVSLRDAASGQVRDLKDLDCLYITTRQPHAEGQPRQGGDNPCPASQGRQKQLTTQEDVSHTNLTVENRHSPDASRDQHQRPGPKEQAPLQNSKHERKCRVIESGLELAENLESQGKQKEADAQYERTLVICRNLLGQDSVNLQVCGGQSLAHVATQAVRKVREHLSAPVNNS